MLDTVSFVDGIFLSCEECIFEVDDRYGCEVEFDGWQSSVLLAKAFDEAAAQTVTAADFIHCLRVVIRNFLEKPHFDIKDPPLPLWQPDLPQFVSFRATRPGFAFACRCMSICSFS